MSSHNILVLHWEDGDQGHEPLEWKNPTIKKQQQPMSRRSCSKQIIIGAFDPAKSPLCISPALLPKSFLSGDVRI